MLHPYTYCAFPSGLAPGLSQKRLCAQLGMLCSCLRRQWWWSSWGWAALCRALKVTLDSRQGRRRRKEAQMGRRTQRRNGDSLCSGTLLQCLAPNHSDGTTQPSWGGQTLLLPLGQSLLKGPHPILFGWLSVFLVVYKHPKASSSSGDVSLALPWHAGVLGEESHLDQIATLHNKATGTYSWTQL